MLVLFVCISNSHLQRLYLPLSNPELPVGGAQPELPVPSDLPSALLLLVLLHVLFILLFLSAGTGDRPATTAAAATTTSAAATARHNGRTRVSTWWVNTTSPAGRELGEFGDANRGFYNSLMEIWLNFWHYIIHTYVYMINLLYHSKAEEERFWYL